ncbi:MAG TPA: 30S ribosomal protein S20 [Rhodospirillaceae bacterium]|nr:30S ribosomal protein S20 [Candidatus Neomarinimicrobiota bacterium]HCX15167.1 30S ribosomal protein S20 [Rhodospirillaceae bacterium]
MANHISAKKRRRRNARAGIVSSARLSRIRGLIRLVESAIVAGDQPAAQLALKQVEPELMRGARKGVMHKNTASRKLSRLAARVKSLAA